MTEKPMSIIESAMEIAEKLPEKYQVAAFAELVCHGLRSAPVLLESDPDEQVRAGPDIPEEPSLGERLVAELPNDFDVAEKGSRAQQALWAVVKLWQDGAEATPLGVCDTIKMKLGKTAESPDNTSKTLRKLTPRYLERHRSQKGRGYTYVPKKNALEVFDGIQEGGKG
jgi:hypothetical protein